MEFLKNWTMEQRLQLRQLMNVANANVEEFPK
jgi:hypothetical protein